MRILQVNKFLYRRGGAEAYMLGAAELLQESGHEVAYFGMEHPENPPHRYQRWFPSNVELDPPPTGTWSRLTASARMVWSVSAMRGMEAVLEDFRPDVVHLHNIYHQLSPSILRPIQRRGIPAVMTLHDYKLACPSIHFLDRGQVCDACLGGHFTQAVRRKCKDDSFAKSALLAGELSLHTALNAYGPVQVFICPSSFIREKMEAAGVFPDRLRQLPNFVDVVAQPKSAPGGPVVYASRLHPEKGVDVLVEAMGHVRGGSVLKIAGDGPERGRLESLANSVAPGQVEFLGVQTREGVRDLLRSALVSVAPSRCYENQPLAVLEAFSAGVPVIGSRLGGIAELVRDGETGFLVPPNDPRRLAAAIDEAERDHRQTFELGQRARSVLVDGFAPEVHLRRLLDLYEEARQATVATRSRPRSVSRV